MNIILSFVALGAGLLYVWLGLNYAAIIIAAIFCISGNVVSFIPTVLISQALTSILGAKLRSSLIEDTAKNTLKGLAMAISALIAFLSASIVGTILNDNIRVLLIAVIVLLSAFIIAIPTSKNRYEEIHGMELIIGGIGGIVKGILGGGITPLLIALQKVCGIDIDSSIFRTLISEIVLCISAAIPYIVTYSIDFIDFIAIAIPSMIGAVIGLRIFKPLDRELRQRFVLVSMVVLSLILFIKFLHGISLGGINE